MKILPKKSLGQNFLIDKNIISKITNIINIDEEKTVMEIGAGYGNLTESIISMNPKKIIAIEKDKKLASLLITKFMNYKNIKKNVHLTSISGGTDVVGCLVLGNIFSDVYAGEIQGESLGIDVDVFDEKGNSINGNKKGTHI